MARHARRGRFPVMGFENARKRDRSTGRRGIMIGQGPTRQPSQGIPEMPGEDSRIGTPVLETQEEERWRIRMD
jgi:hypothetical protein